MQWNPKLRAWMPEFTDSPLGKLTVVVLCIVSLACISVLFMAAATQFDLTTQVRGILAIANGGTNTSSTLTGIVRGGASFTAAELSGDATTSGSNVVTVPKVNGTSVPTNAAADQALITTASQTGAWVTLPAGCAGAINYVSASHTFTCVAVLTGTFAPAEVPTGLINSANTTYTLAHTPSPAASLELYKNGQQLIAGGADYTLATATITMVSAPKTGDVLMAYYRW